MLQLFAGYMQGSKVNEHEVVIRAAGDQINSAGKQPVCERFCIIKDCLLIGLEFRLERFAETNSFCRDSMHQRASLRAGENGLINRRAKLLL